MSFFGAVGHWFESLWKGISGQLKTSIETFLQSFVKDDLGALAVDAVNFVQASIPVETDDAKRAAAIAKFVADATTAGHDLSTFAVSLLNWFIETALQAVKAGVVKATTPAV